MSLPFNVLIAYAVFSPVLVLYVPDHHCSVDAYLNNSDGGRFTREQLRDWLIPLEGGSLSKCRMYNRSLVSRVKVYNKLLEIFKSSPLISIAQPKLEDDFSTKEDLESMETVPCTNGWTYNLTGLFTSAVTEVGETV